MNTLSSLYGFKLSKVDRSNYDMNHDGFVAMNILVEQNSFYISKHATNCPYVYFDCFDKGYTTIESKIHLDNALRIISNLVKEALYKN